MSDASAPKPKATRMDAADRRELVLDAAMRAFARGGYAGTSTDAVAKEAGVSQPYVVRMFGTKVELFRLVFQRSVDGIMAAFEAVLAAGPLDPDDDSTWQISVPPTPIWWPIATC